MRLWSTPLAEKGFLECMFSTSPAHQILVGGQAQTIKVISAKNFKKPAPAGLLILSRILKWTSNQQPGRND